MAVAQKERERDSHEAERGLRVLGQPELILVRFGEQAAEAPRFGELVAELGDLGDLQELPSHPGLLRALARVDERDTTLGALYAVLMTSRPL